MVAGFRIRSAYRRISLYSLGFLVLLLTVLSRSNPTAMGGFVRCPVNKFLGLQCPGCGSLRAVYHLLHGDISGALQLNWLAVVLLPLLIISSVSGVVSGKDVIFADRRAKPFIYGFILVLTVFTVLRNVW